MSKAGRLWPPIVLALLCAAFYWDALWLPSDRVLSGHDLTHMFLPWLDFALSSLRQGRFPLWNPYLFSGHPFVANPQPALFYPPTWLALLLPVTQTLGLIAVLHLWLAGAGMYAWLRSEGASVAGALLGAVTFAFGGYFLVRVRAGHLGVITTEAWLPLLLWAYRRAVRLRSWRWAVVSGLPAGLSLLAGHTSSFLYVASGLIACAAFCVWERWQERAGFTALLPLALAGVALGVGLALWLSTYLALLAAVLFSAAYPEHAGSALLLALQGLLLLAAALLFFLAGRQRLVTWLRHVAGQLAALFRPLWAGALLLLAGGVLSAGAWLSGDLLYKSVERVMAGGTEDISSGHTEHGHPWIGAARPRLVVKEYSDYQCPFCRKAHLAIRQVVRERKDWLRLVHVQVPLDNKCNPMLKRPFHRHACRCALAAICADEQGAFWKMNDLLFAVRCNLDATTPERLAAELGLDGRRFRRCLAGEQARARLSADLAECRSVAQECREAGRKFGTPTFVVGKRVVVGAKPADFWRKLVDELAAER